MASVTVTKLSPGVSRLHDPKGNPMAPKRHRGRPKKGQGTNGGRTHDWKFPPARHPDGGYASDAANRAALLGRFRDQPPAPIVFLTADEVGTYTYGDDGET